MSAVGLGSRVTKRGNLWPRGTVVRIADNIADVVWTGLDDYGAARLESVALGALVPSEILFTLRSDPQSLGMDLRTRRVEMALRRLTGKAAPSP